MGIRMGAVFLSSFDPRVPWSRIRWPNGSIGPLRPQCWALLLCALLLPSAGNGQQPAEPVDISPLDGGVYYVLNQLSGLQADLNNDSTTAADHVIQQGQSFTSTSQRWAMTRLTDGSWKISNIYNQFCLDSSSSSGTTWAIQNPCGNATTQEWQLVPTANGYYGIQNASTGLALDVSTQPTSGTGAWLTETSVSGSVTQSQQWLLRPVFFRGIDNAMLEKQEAARVSGNIPWWNDAGVAQDVLQIFKNHGINMVRLRPTSMPPYATQSSSGPCVQNLCTTESDAQDLDLAKRSKNLGMSVELTLLFDGGSSSSMPAAWANDSFAQLQTDLYNYVFQEIEAYRQAGVMPDLVSIGNEVDTGFLNGNDPGANFANFAMLQTAAMNAVRAAAADTSTGPALPPPLLCIHITPAWGLTSFFSQANSYSIPYDAICQSYYPIYHGPLTAAQSAASNPNNQPIEQNVLTNAATTVGKPIFIIETGEHYESGFVSNDPWYSPPTEASQRQFLIDLDSVLQGLPDNLGMGFEYWDPAGVNIPNPSGGFLNGDDQPNAIYTWNGLTLFDNADASGTTNVNAPNYSALLPATDALGGKFDPALFYGFVNLASGNVLESVQGSKQSGASLDTAIDTGEFSLSQQWQILGNGDGYFRIVSANGSQTGVPNVLDDANASTVAGTPVVQATANASEEQEWDVVTAGNGYFQVVNHLSGLVLDLSSAGLAVQQQPDSSTQTQQWAIVPVRISSATAAGFSIVANPPTLSVLQGAQGLITLTLSPSGGYAGPVTFACSGLPTDASCEFSPSTVTFDGTDAVQSAALTLSTQAAARVPSALPQPSTPPDLGHMVVFLTFLAGFLWLGKIVRQGLPRTMLGIALLCIMVGSLGCGSGGGSGQASTPPPPPTPTGQSIVTITATPTSGSTSSSSSTAILLDVTP
jgi:arabinogalactan endo-1,4-beta-galactosidase